MPGCKGDQRAHHFVHHAPTSCAGAYESALHKLAKQLIADRRLVTTPAIVARHGSAWADLAEGEPGTVSIARAIEVCPFALPLLLDGCSEPLGYGHDRTGPLAARAYAIEAFCWQDTPGALAALEPFRAVADRRIAEAKRKFAETWGSPLSPEHRRPIPEQWRV